MKKLKLIKNYYLIFDNSAFSKDNSNIIKLEISSFRSKKNAMKTIENLEKISEIKFILLWRKRTKVCYIYKAENWNETKDKVIEKMENAYKFKTKKELVIKEFENKRTGGN